MPVSSVAVVGAGVAGLCVASELVAAGVNVTLFDKARGPGGRLSSRRFAQESAVFDLGAPYFTVSGNDCLTWTDAMQSKGVLECWSASSNGPITNCFVGSPRMSALTRELSEGINMKPQTRIVFIQRESGFWQLLDQHGAKWGGFDQVVLAIPPKQALPFVEMYPSVTRILDGQRLDPAWVVMLSFGRMLPVTNTVMHFSSGSIERAIRDSSKPGRSSHLDTWILHSSGAWSREHLDVSPAQVLLMLKNEFKGQIDVKDEPMETAVHRWLYANLPPNAQVPEKSGIEVSDVGLWLAGDWIGGGGVEGAWRSGHYVATRILERIAFH
ncbi:MAG: FAD-dependent oxidoreductase [Hahellaceae bacterium]|nr:FAD-dependent oxidoreductase [Hahellaceae bacterium]MCP5168613.1 FAD-dependent oxidoreductase [Hahellaceae bacterium]